MMFKPKSTADKASSESPTRAIKINLSRGLPLAVLNATLAVSLGVLSLAWSGTELAGGLGLIFPTAALYPLERVVVIPFIFSFVYGAWMAHRNGGKIWIVVLSILSLFSLLSYEWYRAHINPVHFDLDLFLACVNTASGAVFGHVCFKQLRARSSMKTSLVLAQIYLLAFPFVLATIHFCKIPNTLMTYVLTSLTLGALAARVGGGRSLAVSIIMMLISLTLPSIAGLGVMALYNSHGFWSQIGCCFVVLTAIGYHLAFTAIGTITGHLVLRAWLPPNGTAASPADETILAKSLTYRANEKGKNRSGASETNISNQELLCS
jgi:hypothetical protein